jgi:succinoglycan biosynthesis protein ExoA
MSLASLESPTEAVAGPSPALFISIIVPVRNEAAHIRATLTELLAQDYDSERFEVIVADGGSIDRTRVIVDELMRDHANLRLLVNKRRWSSAGRNAAIRAARGDIILLIDGHCELRDGKHLREVAAAFARSGADCLGRPQPLDVTDATLLQRAIAAARSSRLGHHPASFIYEDAEGFVAPHSVAVAYRREVFERIGLFDESFDACEDYELNTRVAKAGMTCFFTPRIGVHYFPRRRLAGLFRQMMRYGRGRVRLFRKHRDAFPTAATMPALFLLGLLTGPFLALVWPALWFIYGAVLGVYAKMVLAFALAVGARQRSLGILALLPAVFATIHAGAGWGVLLETFGGKRSAAAWGESANPQAAS